MYALCTNEKESEHNFYYNFVSLSSCSSAFAIRIRSFDTLLLFVFVLFCFTSFYLSKAISYLDLTSAIGVCMHMHNIIIFVLSGHAALENAYIKVTSRVSLLTQNRIVTFSPHIYRLTLRHTHTQTI